MAATSLGVRERRATVVTRHLYPHILLAEIATNLARSWEIRAHRRARLVKLYAMGRGRFCACIWQLWNASRPSFWLGSVSDRHRRAQRALR